MIRLTFEFPNHVSASQFYESVEIDSDCGGRASCSHRVVDVEAGDERSEFEARELALRMGGREAR